MNTKKIFPDDPRLTAYALGELTGGERAEFEALLAQDPAAQQTVTEIRALGGQLEAALGDEPVPAASAPATAPFAEPSSAPARTRRDGANVRRFRPSQLYYLASGLAAAGFVALIAVKGPQLPTNATTDRLEEQTRPNATVATKPSAADAGANAETMPAAQPAAKPAVPGATADRPSPAAIAATQTPAQAQDAMAGAVIAPVAPPPEEVASLPQASPGRNEIAAASIAPTAAAASATASMPPPQGLEPLVPAPSAARPRVAPTRPSLAGAGLVAQSQALHEAESQAGDPGLAALAAPNVASRVANTPSAPLFESQRADERDTTLRKDARLTRARAEKQRAVQGGQRGRDIGYVDLARTAANAAAGVTSLAPVNDELVVLSPFMVETPMKAGYEGTNRLAGTRAGRPRPFNTEAYAYRQESDFVSVAAEPLSTFSADVDTASYANVRRFLAAGQLPPPDAVRIEELLNAFTYAYPAPARAPAGGAPAAGVPFAADLEVAAAPWAPAHRLVRIGIRGRDLPVAERGPANLVFLLDVSGSMSDENKLPLVKQAMKRLLTRLRADDHVAIVTYAGTSGMALPSTPLSRKAEIEEAIEALHAGGSTNGAMGLQLAYDVAKANFVTGGVNRVILCTDGDFNVGTTGEGSLVRLIREKTGTGVFLSVFGFGMGNLKDSMLQQVADAGNGNYGYIDTLAEAERRLVGQVNGTLVTIAKDVKLQVEFNPAKVSRYRLIGYEKRRLAAADFKNDAVDAGEIGAGHTVTALYEIEPAVAGAPASAAADDEARPQRYVDFATAPGRRPGTDATHAGELLTLRIRYKQPDGLVSRKLEFPLTDAGAAFEQASGDFKFASAVAAFGMILRDSAYRGTATMESLIGWAEAGIAADPDGSRMEFVQLVKQAQALRR